LVPAGARFSFVVTLHEFPAGESSHLSVSACAPAR
jgi:hypothetical protein